MNERIGTVSSTEVLVVSGEPWKGPTVYVQSGGQALAWTPEDAEQIAGLLLRAARVARAQGGCIRASYPA